MRALAHTLVPAVLLSLACSTEQEPAADELPIETDSGSVGYSLDEVLHLNEIQMKATHNSYHVEKAGNPIPDWAYTESPLDQQIDQQGVRSFELDTHFVEGTSGVDVYHVPELDDGTVCNPLSDCLTILKTWSDAHPGHHPLVVHVEPKERSLNQTVDFAAYSDALDAVILSVWPRDRVLTPDDVRGDGATLRDAVTASGWPTLGALRGKILFYLNERDMFHDAYTRGGADVSGRVAFPESQRDEPIAAVLVMNDPTDPEIAAAVREGFLVRTRTDGVPKPVDFLALREAALASGAQILSTDFPVAQDGGDPGFDLPGGTPSRCNPVLAPAGCSPAAVESPELLSTPGG